MSYLDTQYVKWVGALDPLNQAVFQAGFNLTVVFLKISHLYHRIVLRGTIRFDDLSHSYLFT
jgi:hypothetical protein